MRLRPFQPRHGVRPYVRKPKVPSVCAMKPRRRSTASTSCESPTFGATQGPLPPPLSSLHHPRRRPRQHRPLLRLPHLFPSTPATSWILSFFALDYTECDYYEYCEEREYKDNDQVNQVKSEVRFVMRTSLVLYHQLQLMMLLHKTSPMKLDLGQ